MPLTPAQIRMFNKGNPYAGALGWEEIKNVAMQAAERVAREKMREIEDEMKKTLKKSVEEKMHLMEMLDEDELEEMVQDISAVVLHEIPKPKDGYTPRVELDYPSYQQIEQFTRRLFASIEIPKPQDGYTPIAGKDYPDREQMKMMCAEYIKGMKCLTEQDIPALYEKMKKAFPTLEMRGEDIVQKINALPMESDKQIDARHIKNLLAYMPSAKKGSGIMRGGGDVYVAQSLTPNGTATSFTVNRSSKSLMLVASDDLPHLLFENNGFTLNSARTTLTLATGINAPQTGSKLTYLYVSL